MSIKRLINEKTKHTPLKLSNYPFVQHETDQMRKSPINYRNRDVVSHSKPFRIAKSSTKRRVSLIQKQISEIQMSLPQIKIRRNKAFEKEKSNNELLYLSNTNRNNQFKLNTFYSNNHNNTNTKKTYLINYQTEMRPTLCVNNNNITPVQLFKVNKDYASTLLKYSCQTKAGTNVNGYMKTNQDSYLSKHKIFGLSNFSLFGVFDGHGMNGHLVSRFLRDFFLTYYTKVETFDKVIGQCPASLQSNSHKEKDIHALLTKDFLFQSCTFAENRLKKVRIDTSFSGSTGVILIHIEDILYCLNTGDSRAIYINDEGRAIQITRDHKPNLFDEEKRIKIKGGRVDRAPGSMNIGPYRVWLRQEDYPGLAMSRSYGDNIAKSIGVISEPGKYLY